MKLLESHRDPSSLWYEKVTLLWYLFTNIDGTKKHTQTKGRCYRQTVVTLKISRYYSRSLLVADGRDYFTEKIRFITEVTSLKVHRMISMTISSINITSSHLLDLRKPELSKQMLDEVTFPAYRLKVAPIYINSVLSISNKKYEKKNKIIENPLRFLIPLV